MKPVYTLLIVTLLFTCNTFAQPIDTTAIVDIGGIKQYVTIKGSDRTKPVLLFLHGGPGRSLIPFADAFTKRLQTAFVVAQWDQRETGETQKLNTSKERITVQLMQRDALDMVQYLLKRFHHKKLYLASHSWGSTMGFDIAKKHPELLYAFIPISPMVDAEKASALTVNMLKKWASENKNDTAIRELARIHLPYQKEEDIYLGQKWLFVHNEVDGAGTDVFKNIFYNWMATWLPVWLDASKTNLFITAPKLQCPIYIFEGRGDNQTWASLAEEYYKALKAPKKQLLWFENSGHTIFNSEPEKIESLLIEKVLPETMGK